MTNEEAYADLAASGGLASEFEVVLMPKKGPVTPIKGRTALINGQPKIIYEDGSTADIPIPKKDNPCSKPS